MHTLNGNTTVNTIHNAFNKTKTPTYSQIAKKSQNKIYIDISATRVGAVIYTEKHTDIANILLN